MIRIDRMLMQQEKPGGALSTGSFSSMEEPFALMIPEKEPSEIHMQEAKIRRKPEKKQLSVCLVDDFQSCIGSLDQRFNRDLAADGILHP